MREKEIIDELLGEMILRLVKEHSANCDNPDCGINLLLIYDRIYKKLVSQKIADKNFKNFA